MDILSDILRDQRLTSAVFSVAEFGAPWGFDKEAVGGAPFYVVVEGRCLFHVQGSDPVELMAGDLIVLPHGTPFSAMSEPTSRRAPFARILESNGIDPTWAPGKRIQGLNRISFGGNGPATRLIIGVFGFRNRDRNPFLTALPSFIHVPGWVKQGRTWLESAVKLLIDEAEASEPGYHAVVERLADVIFVRAVREAMATTLVNSSSWLRGLTDPQIARAMALVHAEPQQRWTVASLASAVALSRTAFANRFRRLVGSSVMEYVTEHRMQLARDLLVDSDLTMAEIASKVGYGSDVSFNRAFRHHSGVPPSRYRRHRNKKSA